MMGMGTSLNLHRAGSGWRGGKETKSIRRGSRGGWGHSFEFSPPSHLGDVLSFVVVVQFLSCVWLFVIPRTAACQPSLSATISQSLLKLMSIESIMPFNHLILYRPILLLPSIFPSIRVFSSESALVYQIKPWTITPKIYKINSK